MANKWRVQQENVPHIKYQLFDTISEDDCLVLYFDPDNKWYECALYKGNRSEIAFSLFRESDHQRSVNHFDDFRSCMQPFLRAFSQSSSLFEVRTLQMICDIIRQGSGFLSPAHLAVLVNLPDSLSSSGIVNSVNSTAYENGKTPLLLAIEGKSPCLTHPSHTIDLVKSLVDCGARLDRFDNDGESAFHYTVRRTSNSIHVLNALPHNIDCMNQPNKKGVTPVQLAVQLGNLEAAKALLDKGATSPAIDEVDLDSPIQDERIVTSILRKHRHPTCNARKSEPTDWAKTPGLRQLLRAKDNVNAIGNDGKTALIKLILDGKVDCAITLLLDGANPNVADRDGNTPLHHAVKLDISDSVHMAKALIIFGADVSKLNNRGQSVRHIAATQGHYSSPHNQIQSKFVMVLDKMGAERCPTGTAQCARDCHYDVSPDVDDLREDEMQEDNDGGPSDQFVNEFIESLSPTTSGGFDDIDVAKTLSARGSSSPQMRSKDTVLCLDGGGIKGLVLIQMLAAIEKATGKRINQLFDWIVGTSTGGILAIALSQGYSVADCRKLYMALKDEVFRGNRPYKTETLESFLKEAFGQNTKMTEYKHPRILVTTTVANRAPPALHFFRNFDPPSRSSTQRTANIPGFPQVRPPSAQCVWEAARATSAAPTYFQPMGFYVDGGVVANNPTVDAMTEIQEYYMDKQEKGEEVRQIGLVVSLGTGRSPLSYLAQGDLHLPTGIGDFMKSFVLFVVSGLPLIKLLVSQVCESTVRSVDRARAWCFSIGAPYFRLCPPIDADIELDEKDDYKLVSMMYDCEVYLREKQNDLGKIKKILEKLSSSR